MKKLLKILAVGAFLLSTTQALADKVKVLEPASEEQVYRDSSAFHRIDKSFTLNYIAFGIGPSRSGSIGGTFGFFLDRNSEIDIEVINGRPYTYDFSFASNYDIKTNSFGVHYKRFVGNSFYYRGGIDYRNVDYSHISYDIFTPSTILSREIFKGSSITATFLIGNQWQWENFTLGCDWFGIALPVTSQVDSESVSGTSPSQKNLKDEEENFLKKETSTSLRFYLGASF